jgi:large subunit ribosomal protein L6
MSKLARKPIKLNDVDAVYENNTLNVKGKHGELSLRVSRDVSLLVENGYITVSSEHSSMLGLHAALIKNMVTGVTQKFTQTLSLKGVGYRVTLSNGELNFNLGYSHPVVYKCPDGVTPEVVSPTEIKLISIDKQQVGQVAAEIIKLRPAKKDPYKEKGIKRIQDRIIKKVGKKVK